MHAEGNGWESSERRPIRPTYSSSSGSSSESLYDQLCGSLVSEPKFPFDDFGAEKHKLKKASKMKKQAKERAFFLQETPNSSFPANIPARLVFDTPSTAASDTSVTLNHVGYATPAASNIQNGQSPLMQNENDDSTLSIERTRAKSPTEDQGSESA